MQDGAFDVAESDSDEASQQAECDADSVRANSNVDMESVATSDGLDVAQEALWDNIVESSVLLKYDQPSSNTPSSTLGERDERIWEDILKNHSLPDYDDAFEDTQEGENTTIAEHCADGGYDEDDSQAGEDFQVDDDSDNRTADVSQMEDGGSLSDNDAESVTEFDEHDGHVFDKDDGLDDPEVVFSRFLSSY
ncbi:hypothetical protein GN958_ATG16063 [Phytophthora infestans]|uniref:Uncharacterized protein n=1 Tax=Phytophthora infestans TaxID=4787 RepID=A0A8S9U5V8_PHYIN|nr:hypothetical protein GN958_ATG16063 [Phytophthora infestans]